MSTTKEKQTNFALYLTYQIIFKVLFIALESLFEAISLALFLNRYILSSQSLI